MVSSFVVKSSETATNEMETEDWNIKKKWESNLNFGNPHSTSSVAS